jgi:hypothetical protein
MPYAPHAQLLEKEQWLGRRREPTPEQLAVIEAYGEKYREAFGEWPAGTHWVDALGLFVSFLRPGGLPDAASPRL